MNDTPEAAAAWEQFQRELALIDHNAGVHSDEEETNPQPEPEEPSSTDKDSDLRKQIGTDWTSI
jgi:hypothetical protein